MMSKRHLSVVGQAAMFALAMALPAEAGLLANLANSLNAPQPAKATNTVSVSHVAGSDCCAPESACCPQPCIQYRHKGPKLYRGCDPPIEMVLRVRRPCSPCEVDVAVCLPACCTGEPTVCQGSGFLGRDVVEYEWCCGYRVRVAFKHCGDLLVTTWGR